MHKNRLGLFTVGTHNETWSGADDLVQILKTRNLLKSLSLVLGAAADVVVPPTLLLLGHRVDLIDQFAHEWGYPLMIRMDYAHSPAAKPLGGIPLRHRDSVIGFCSDLLKRGCFPLLHPHIDRFKDLSSAGIVIKQDESIADIEIVGRGFDAGDLRLGSALAHESLRVDLFHGTVKTHQTINQRVYRTETIARKERIRKLIAYTEAANSERRIPRKLSLEQPTSRMPLLPARYAPLSSRSLRELFKISREVVSFVIPRLPPSSIYVASLSKVPKVGWILWDVYGNWYRR